MKNSNMKSKKRLEDLSVEWHKPKVKCGICHSSDTVKQKLVYCEKCGYFEIDYGYNLTTCSSCKSKYSSIDINLCITCWAYEWHKCPDCDRMMWFRYRDNKMGCKCL